MRSLIVFLRVASFFCVVFVIASLFFRFPCKFPQHFSMDADDAVVPSGAGFISGNETVYNHSDCDIQTEPVFVRPSSGW